MYGMDPTSDNYERTASNNTARIDKDIVPYTVLVAKTVNNVVSQRPLKVLFDSGSTSDFVYPSCLPHACRPESLEHPIEVSMLDNSTSVNQYVCLEDVVLTELSLSKHIDKLTCYLPPKGTSCNYDMIIGRKTM